MLKIDNLRVVISVINDLVTDQRMHKTATSLINNGHDVILVGRKLKNSPIINRNYKTIRFKLLFNNGFLFYANYNIRLFFYLLFTKFDILLSCDLDTLPSNFLTSRIKNKRLVYDSHEYFTEVPELKKRKFVKNIWLKIEKLILPRIKYAYTVSDSISDIYSRKYNVNFDVIKNFPMKQNIESIDIAKNKKKVILYQGAVNIGRGIKEFIDAMKYIEDAVFQIIGDGDIKKELEEYVIQENLSEKVKFYGRVSLENLKEFTLKADLGISLEQGDNLNYYYSLPNKIFDYIQAEVPILASDLPEISRIINENEIGITIDDFSQENISKIVNSIFLNENLIYKWKSNLISIKDNYTWERQEQKLLQLIIG